MFIEVDAYTHDKDNYINHILTILPNKVRKYALKSSSSSKNNNMR